MADAVAFERVEEQYLTRLSHGLVAPQMAHVGAAIGKNQMDSARALLRALVPAAALAVHIPDRDRRGLQQRVNGKFRHACSTEPAAGHASTDLPNGAERGVARSTSRGGFACHRLPALLHEATHLLPLRVDLRCDLRPAPSV